MGEQDIEDRLHYAGVQAEPDDVAPYIDKLTGAAGITEEKNLDVHPLRPLAMVGVQNGARPIYLVDLLTFTETWIGNFAGGDLRVVRWNADGSTCFFAGAGGAAAIYTLSTGVYAPIVTGVAVTFNDIARSPVGGLGVIAVGSNGTIMELLPGGGVIDRSDPLFIPNFLALEWGAGNNIYILAQGASSTLWKYDLTGGPSVKIAQHSLAGGFVTRATVRRYVDINAQINKTTTQVPSPRILVQCGARIYEFLEGMMDPAFSFATTGPCPFVIDQKHGIAYISGLVSGGTGQPQLMKYVIGSGDPTNAGNVVSFPIGARSLGIDWNSFRVYLLDPSGVLYKYIGVQPVVVQGDSNFPVPVFPAPGGGGIPAPWYVIGRDHQDPLRQWEIIDQKLRTRAETVVGQREVVRTAAANATLDITKLFDGEIADVLPAYTAAAITPTTNAALVSIYLQNSKADTIDVILQTGIASTGSFRIVVYEHDGTGSGTMGIVYTSTFLDVSTLPASTLIAINHNLHGVKDIGRVDVQWDVTAAVVNTHNIVEIVIQRESEVNVSTSASLDTNLTAEDVDYTESSVVNATGTIQDLLDNNVATGITPTANTAVIKIVPIRPFYCSQVALRLVWVGAATGVFDIGVITQNGTYHKTVTVGGFHTKFISFTFQPGRVSRITITYDGSTPVATHYIAEVIAPKAIEVESVQALGEMNRVRPEGMLGTSDVVQIVNAAPADWVGLPDVLLDPYTTGNALAPANEDAACAFVLRPGAVRSDRVELEWRAPAGAPVGIFTISVTVKDRQNTFDLMVDTSVHSISATPKYTILDLGHILEITRIDIAYDGATVPANHYLSRLNVPVHPSFEPVQLDASRNRVRPEGYVGRNDIDMTGSVISNYLVNAVAGGTEQVRRFFLGPQAPVRDSWVPVNFTANLYAALIQAVKATQIRVLVDTTAGGATGIFTIWGYDWNGVGVSKVVDVSTMAVAWTWVVLDLPGDFMLARVQVLNDGATIPVNYKLLGCEVPIASAQLEPVQARGDLNHGRPDTNIGVTDLDMGSSVIGNATGDIRDLVLNNNIMAPSLPGITPTSNLANIEIYFNTPKRTDRIMLGIASTGAMTGKFQITVTDTNAFAVRAVQDIDVSLLGGNPIPIEISLAQPESIWYIHILYDGATPIANHRITSLLMSCMPQLEPVQADSSKNRVRPVKRSGRIC